MHNSDHHIERYLSGDMTTQEKKKFLQEVKNDAALKEALELEDGLRKHLKGDFETAKLFQQSSYKKELSNFISSPDGRFSKIKIKEAQDLYFKSKVSKTKWVRIITTSAAILMILFGLFYMFTQPSSENLYAQYYDPTDLPSFTQRTDKTNKLSAITQSFKDEQWLKTQEEIDVYLNSATQINPLVYIYQGLTSTEQGNLPDAISAYERLENAETIDASRAFWFKALTYLKFNNKEKATEVLQTITQDQNNYKYREAVILLNKLQ